jgi:hypothetical protein
MSRGEPFEGVLFPEALGNVRPAWKSSCQKNHFVTGAPQIDATTVSRILPSGKFKLEESVDLGFRGEALESGAATGAAAPALCEGAESGVVPD